MLFTSALFITAKNQQPPKCLPFWTYFSSFTETSLTYNHGIHQMVNTEIRWIVFFVDKDGDALYSQQKQDQELTVAQIMNSYCQTQI